MSILIAINSVFAAPANSDPIFVEQAGGKTIELYNRGDEFLSWLEDPEGNLVVYDDQTSAYYYAVWTNDGAMSTGQLVTGMKPAGRSSILASTGSDIPQEVLDNAAAVQEGNRFNKASGDHDNNIPTLPLFRPMAFSS